MKTILIFTLLIPFIGRSQDNGGHGIHFEQGLSWEKIKNKALAERKYIFVDCYATWCLPCKAMDKNVYIIDSLGDYMNKKFISVKVQMDTSQQDSAEIINWYAAAHEISNKYRVESVPSYIFFSPDGVPVHKDAGVKKIGQFLAMARDAVDPKKQYYTICRAYLEGQKDYSTLPDLAYMAQRIGETSTAAAMVNDYIKNFLLVSDERKRFTKENIRFMMSFPQLLNSKTIVFEILFKHSDDVDKAIGIEKFSIRNVDKIISTEEITPEIIAAKKSEITPDWNRIEKKIEDKYGSKYAQQNIIAAKIDWYKYKQDWKNYTKSIIILVTNYSFEDFVFLNNEAYEIYKYSEDKNELITALSWADRSMKLGGEGVDFVLDTKANLLFKLGRRTEAIALEEKAAELAGGRNKDLRDNFEKMKKEYQSHL